MMFGFTLEAGLHSCISCTRTHLFEYIFCRPVGLLINRLGGIHKSPVRFVYSHSFFSTYTYFYSEWQEQNLLFNISTDASGQSCGPR